MCIRDRVSGSTKKMYRQKGTGNARAGSKRAPQRRGGGHAMQLKPRKYYYRMPRKAIRLATRMAIASKLNDGQVVVIDKLEMAAPKTKELAGLLKSLGLSGVTTLVATGEYSSSLYMSSRNIPGVQVTKVADLNALCVLKPKRLLVTREALELIKTHHAAPAPAEVA